MKELNLSAFSLLVNRKSVRDFTPQCIEPEKRQQIYEAILSAPTTENMMMYSVISVQEPSIREQLSKQSAIRKAPLVLVFCADYRRWSRIFQAIRPGSRMPEEGEYQLALIDAVIAAQNAVIAAEALGLHSVYLGDIMEHYEERADALGLPAGVIPVCTLCIGYGTPQQLARAKVRRYPCSCLIHENQYQDVCFEDFMEALCSRGGYQSQQEMLPWLERFSARCTDGNSALERTRSIRAAVKSFHEAAF